ncbi:MAG: hypothetical protein K2N41_05155 [Lachnospiraceae bacterium]|nr:hypothetical protein [Lachnospiraceae bacterium]
MNMKNTTLEFEKLLKQVEKLIKFDLSADQAVAVWTSKDNMFCFANHSIMSGNMEDENNFVRTFAENGDKEIRYVVCMWNDTTLDVPSCHLRDLLIELNPSNLETEILLNNGEGFQVKSLKMLMP